jgi:hypothetical protein
MGPFQLQIALLRACKLIVDMRKQLADIAV